MEFALREMTEHWLPHQVLASRLWGRTGHQQCGGAWGFRDQLQDVGAFFGSRPELARRQIARCAAAQFPEGDALHWWHRLPGQNGLRGVRTRYADDYLWLPFMAADYALQTGDWAFLHVQIPFREGPPLQPDECERYALYARTAERASLLEHCVRAAERGLSLRGVHGLPLMQGGDWNDGMNSVGQAGAGESVWLGMFMRMELERMAQVLRRLGEGERAVRYEAESQALCVNIDRHCWAGNRYLRAFWDDGAPLGGRDGAPCAIDILPQAFASLCGMPDAQRRNLALSTALARLADREHGLVRLLREPFPHTGKRAGYINDYPPGVRENGGQYTHAAVWLCMALCKEGRAQEAEELLSLLNPAAFCQEPQRAQNYRGEPYALAGDVSGAPGCEGRAGWTLYTGSAAWFLRCAAAFE